MNTQNKSSKISDYMTKEPLCVPHDTKVGKAISIMKLNNIRHLPITKDNIPYSVISERELNFVISQSENKDELLGQNIENFCPIDIITVSSDESIYNVLEIFIKEKIGAILVIDENEFSGIFTLVDVCRILKESLK
jgi:CBS domain-containing protein